MFLKVSNRSASPSANNRTAATTPAPAASRSPVRAPRAAATNAAVEGSDSTTGRQLYVGNLPFSVHWQELKDMFRHVGNVVRAEVQLDNSGRSRGFGQVKK